MKFNIWDAYRSDLCYYIHPVGRDIRTVPKNGMVTCQHSPAMAIFGFVPIGFFFLSWGWWKTSSIFPGAFQVSHKYLFIFSHLNVSFRLPSWFYIHCGKASFQLKRGINPGDKFSVNLPLNASMDTPIRLIPVSPIVWILLSKPPVIFLGLGLLPHFAWTYSVSSLFCFWIPYCSLNIVFCVYKLQFGHSSMHHPQILVLSFSQSFDLFLI